MLISFLLHLYQPSYQSDEVFKRIVDESYSPLLTFLKKNPNFHITLNTPLSLLEKMDELGYQSWIDDLKNLYNKGQVEIVGSAAYHPLLTKIPKNMAQFQIILNEYGLGYYLGSKNFDGNGGVRITNLNGFFSPELASNMNTLNLISDLGYKWAIVDENAFYDVEDYTGSSSIYKIEDTRLKIVVRNSSISNQIAFKRDSIADDINIFEDSIISLDGETFGHHNTQGLRLLENLADKLAGSASLLVTVSQFIAYKKSIHIASVHESSWGASAEDMTKGDIYPLWYSPDTLNKYIQELFSLFISLFDESYEKNTLEFSESLKVWDETSLKDYLSTNNYLKSLLKNIKISKLVSSDALWWSSKKRLPNNVYLYSDNLLKSFSLKCASFNDFNTDETTKKDIKALIDFVIKETDNSTSSIV